MAARAIWKGVIRFGGVELPVKLYSAVEDRRVHFRLLSPKTKQPIRQRMVDPESEEEVPSEEIRKGYEVEPGRYVIVEDEELEALAPEKTRVIDLEVFVPAGAVDPAFFQRGYFLTPAGESNKPYRLLAEALERTERVGIATFVMRGTEYLVAIPDLMNVLRWSLRQEGAGEGGA